MSRRGPETRALVVLRAGDDGPPVFLFPGAGGEAVELAELAQRLEPGRPVIGIEVCAEGGSVEDMATRAAAAIRRRQPNGPYDLIGYSFGALVALEAARQLEAAGEGIARLAMIEAVFDARYWPRRQFAAALARRTVVQLGALSKRPVREVLPTVAMRVRRLAVRLTGRRPVATGLDGAAVPLSPERAACEVALAAYRPSRYLGAVELLRTVAGNEFGCDPAALWRPLAPRLTVYEAPGGHLGVVRQPRALNEVAAILDRPRQMAPAADGPRVLLTTTIGWLATTRLALAFAQAGFTVEALCPRDHSMAKMDFVGRVHRYSVFAPGAALRGAIAAARPDLVIPCDDRAAEQLRALHAEAAGETDLQALIVRSLGAPASYPTLASRAALLAVAAEEGVDCPPTASVADGDALDAWLSRHGAPAVLKTDGSWGGAGVALLREPAASRRTLDRLTRPPGLMRTLKRLVVDGDLHLVGPFLAGRREPASVQGFLPGRPANAAVACLDGKVLAAVYVEAMSTATATGPATVVQAIDNPQMARAVRRLVRRLGLSGLCGFDFVLEPGGRAQFIELNPRATPTCHLGPAGSGWLPQVLRAALEGRRAPAAYRPSGLVALFPQELARDPDSPFLNSARHDAPWESPALVDLSLALIRRPSLSRWLARLRPQPAWIAPQD